VTTSDSASKSTRRLRAADDTGSGNGQRPRRVSAAVAARRAREEFQELTQTPVERVTAVQRTDSGWLVVVDGLELRRIPETMDVLGVYEVELSGRGQVVGWRRVGRHHRSQVEEG
jgi:hypothetical protein